MKTDARIMHSGDLGRHVLITANGSASSYGQPVLWIDGTPHGPADYVMADMGDESVRVTAAEYVQRAINRCWIRAANLVTIDSSGVVDGGPFGPVAYDCNPDAAALLEAALNADALSLAIRFAAKGGAV